ncbi:uncharacterized protein LOC114578824 isoform X2 [Dendrobium catenatum]|uniref:uncharacterized protein LOC114578824 isoform X2 n=1 Tax=Dendrobium catenatum TaxID=906689 RepID=UPI00109FF211|nr:uncharacterized protein LOC114578824 isoform X2 [Dendrobium catenatum]
MFFSAISVGSRPSVARILVELDISEHYPDRICVGPNTFGFIQSVEMKASPSFCDLCKALRHSAVEYHKLHPHLGDNLVGTLSSPPHVNDVVIGYFMDGMDERTHVVNTVINSSPNSDGFSLSDVPST